MVAAEVKEEMGSMTSTWKDERIVESFEIDMNGTLKVHMLFAFLLNSAWNHAKETSFDYRTLSGRNLMWVLSKLKLVVNRLPKWGDRIVIETWGKKIERFYALRDFIVTTAGGEKLASATSAWMILDRISYRPQRLNDLMKDFPWNGEKSEIETDLQKVPEPTTAEIARGFHVSFSDIDVNRHVTAARYLQWLMDSYPVAILTEKELTTAEIGFIAEAVLDDEISVWRESHADKDLCKITRKSDSQDLCRAMIEWKTK
jgi:acyl-ACP thioesterase